MQKFDLSKVIKGSPIVTRDGRAVKFIKVIKPNLKNQEVLYPVVVEIDSITYCMMKDGRFDDEESDMDLFLKEEILK